MNNVRTKFSLIIDTVFIFFVTFIISIIALYYFCSYPFSLIIAIATAVFFSLIFYLLNNKKIATFLLKKQELCEYENVMLSLNLMTKTKQTEFFFNYAKQLFPKATKSTYSIYIPEKNYIVFPKFSFDFIGRSTIIKVLSIHKTYTAIILAEKFNEEERLFAKRFGDKIILMDGVSIFKKLKADNFLPVCKIQIKPQKTLNRPHLIFFQQKKAKRFLFFGILFLAFSFVVPIKTYYIICGLIFFILALLAKLFGKNEQPQQ